MLVHEEASQRFKACSRSFYSHILTAKINRFFLIRFVCHKYPNIHKAGPWVFAACTLLLACLEAIISSVRAGQIYLDAMPGGPSSELYESRLMSTAVRLTDKAPVGSSGLEIPSSLSQSSRLVLAVLPNPNVEPWHLRIHLNRSFIQRRSDRRPPGVSLVAKLCRSL